MQAGRAALLALTALAPAGGPAAAQRLPDPSEAGITVLSPPEWTGAGRRSPGGITFTGETVLVEGLAYHPSGVTRVTIAGNPAVLLRDRSGATRFQGRIPSGAASREVEIVAFPVQGFPFARLQNPNGTFRMVLRESGRPTAPALGALGPLRELRVFLGALAPEARRAVAAEAGGIPGVVLEASAVEAHLGVRAEGDAFVVVGRDGSVRHQVPARDGAAGLAAVLSREVGALQLAEVAAPAGAPGLDFAFAGGTDVFSLGSPIEFRVRAARDGYLTVVDVGTDGTVGVLFPVMEDDPRVRAGQELLLPSTALRSYFAPESPYRATAPTGVGVVRAFVTPRPLRLSTPGSETPDALALLQALRDATRGESGGREGELGWSTAALTYRIVP